MCEFIDEMAKLKSSSNSSVANEEFSTFNAYMHIDSEIDGMLTEAIFMASKKKKALILVLGNSGGGKSHLISKLISTGGIDKSVFDIYIDATSSDKRGVKANKKLRDKFDQFADENIENDVEYRLIVAINQGVLNDFIKNYDYEFSILSEYIEAQGIFDNIPSWRAETLLKDRDYQENYYIGHVDFNSFHRYGISAKGLELSFVIELLNKIVSTNLENPLYQKYVATCGTCPKCKDCPVYWNYSELVKNGNLRKYIVSILVNAIIKNNLSPSVRDINNFFYQIIVGNTFNEKRIDADSIDRLDHFLSNLLLSHLFEGHDDLLLYTAKEDVLNDKQRRKDHELISLNLKNFKKWIDEEAIPSDKVFAVIKSNIVFCETNHAKAYKEEEPKFKQDIFELFIRTKSAFVMEEDPLLNKYICLLYEYNIGNEKACAEVISLIKECAYLWYGRLGTKDGNSVKNAIIYGTGTNRYFLFKKVDFAFVRDASIVLLKKENLNTFSPSMRFAFCIKDKKDKRIFIDVDYELFQLLNDIKNGYVPTSNDRRLSVKYDSFVRCLVAEAKSDLYIYSRQGNGDTYVIFKDDVWDNYVFDRGV